MSVFSEMDIERKYEGDPFASDDVFTEPSGQGTMAQISLASPAEANAEAPAETAGAQPAQTAAEPAASQNTEAASSGTTEAKAESKAPAEDKKAAGDADEDAKRKAHEEAEAKRKAEWEARQAKKKADLQEKINKLAAMSDDEAIKAAMMRVSSDTEKLTRRNMKECVSEHIQTMCLEDPDFARRAMDPRKSMVHCIWYINRKAKEFIMQEMKDNDLKPENGIYGGDVPDELCYQWAVDYFNDPDAKEDKEEEEKFVPKPYTGRSSSSKAKAKKPAPKKKAEKIPTNSPKAAEPDGQMSLLGVAS